MGYLFADGFDNYGNNYVLTAGYPWDSNPNGAGTVITTDTRFSPPGSLPGGCLNILNSGNVLKKNLGANIGTLIVCVGVKFMNLPGVGGTWDVVSFWDGATEQCCLAVNQFGALQFFKGSAGLGTGVAQGSPSPIGTVTIGQWYGFQMQVTFSSSAGAATLAIYGGTQSGLAVSGVNLSQSGNPYSSQVGLGPNGNTSGPLRYDDFLCLDTTGGILNAPFGTDVRIFTKMPSSVGTYANWTPTGLGQNYQNVAVQPPSTADYNANNVPGTKDSYGMQVAGISFSPSLLLLRASLQRDDAGPHTPSLFVRSGGIDSAGVITPALTSSYAFYDAVITNDPATGAPWLSSAADAAQVGIIEG
jgi:hypothetical protein